MSSIIDAIKFCEQKAREEKTSAYECTEVSFEVDKFPGLDVGELFRNSGPLNKPLFLEVVEGMINLRYYSSNDYSGYDFILPDFDGESSEFVLPDFDDESDGFIAPDSID